jgi:branched-chain amino acid aminotransferase
MPLVHGPERVLSEIRRTVSAYRAKGPAPGDLYIRLQVTRGAGAIGLDVALADNPDFLLLVQPCPGTPEPIQREGLRLSIATTLRRNPGRVPQPGMEDGQLPQQPALPSRGAGPRGRRRRHPQPRRRMAEAAVSNIAFVRGGAVVTPPLTAGILGGVTRGLLLGGIAASAGIEAREGPVRPSDLPSMDECFLLSTTKDVVAVREIDGVSFRVAPDSVVSRLKAAFAGAARAYASAHPELAV